MFCGATFSALRGDANSVSHAPSNANNRAIQSTAPLMRKEAPGTGLSSECHIFAHAVTAAWRIATAVSYVSMAPGMQGL